MIPQTHTHTHYSTRELTRRFVSFTRIPIAHIHTNGQSTVEPAVFLVRVAIWIVWLCVKWTVACYADYTSRRRCLCWCVREWRMCFWHDSYLEYNGRFVNLRCIWAELRVHILSCSADCLRFASPMELICVTVYMHVIHAMYFAKGI